MSRLITPLKTLKRKAHAISRPYLVPQRATNRYLHTFVLRPFALTTLNRRYASHFNRRFVSSQLLQTIDRNMMQVAFGLVKFQSILQPPLPQKFFVYGTLRDDNNTNAYWTKDFVKNCVAENAKLYGFKLYHSNDCNFPFAVKTNNKNDYVIGRLLRWNEGTELFEQKLKNADEIEGYVSYLNKNNLYERQIVDVMDNNNNKTKAIVYFRKQTINKTKDYEIYGGDWLQNTKTN
eukprot:522962_1